jgi:hypothetical protein
LASRVKAAEGAAGRRADVQRANTERHRRDRQADLELGRAMTIRR